LPEYLGVKNHKIYQVNSKESGCYASQLFLIWS